MMLLNNLLKSLSRTFFMILCACVFVGATTTSVLADNDCDLENEILYNWDEYLAAQGLSCENGPVVGVNVDYWCSASYLANLDLCQQIADNCSLTSACLQGCVHGSCSINSDCPGSMVCQSGCCVNPGGSGGCSEPCSQHSQCTTSGGGACVSGCCSYTNVSACPGQTMWNVALSTQVGEQFGAMCTSLCTSDILRYCNSNWAQQMAGSANIHGYSCDALGSQSFLATGRCSENNGCGFIWEIVPGIQSCDSCKSGYTKVLLADVVNGGRWDLYNFEAARISAGLGYFSNDSMDVGGSVDPLYTCVDCDGKQYRENVNGRYIKIENVYGPACNKAVSVNYICAAGYYGSPTSAVSGCYECPQNAETCDEGATDFTCKNGYYKSTGACLPCPTATYSTRGGHNSYGYSDTCMDCPATPYPAGSSLSREAATSIAECFVYCNSDGSMDYQDVSGSYRLTGCTDDKCYYNPNI